MTDDDDLKRYEVWLEPRHQAVIKHLKAKHGATATGTIRAALEQLGRATLDLDANAIRTKDADMGKREN